jgi:hypothetical protein
MTDFSQDPQTVPAPAGRLEARYLAFLETISHLRPNLHRYCARMTGSVLDGEDVASTHDSTRCERGSVRGIRQGERDDRDNRQLDDGQCGRLMPHSTCFSGGFR